MSSHGGRLKSGERERRRVSESKRVRERVGHMCEYRCRISKQKSSH
jgi:hypothetical protein